MSELVFIQAGCETLQMNVLNTPTHMYVGSAMMEIREVNDICIIEEGGGSD